MSTLALILADFHLVPQEAPGRALALPPLPALGRLLARATREALPDGWRPWLARQLCTARPAGRSIERTWMQGAATAPAALAAASHLGASDRRHYWFATPVHYFAGIQSVHLHPNGLLSLDAAAQAALAASFGTVFTDGGLQLIPTGRRDLLLAGDAGVAGSDGVRSTDPARWLGADPSPGLPAGPGAGRLRRLGAEIELWLHEHPVNRERVTRGELPVTALWLWGGGVVGDDWAAASAANRSLRMEHGAVLYAQDAFSEALAQLCGARWRLLAVQAAAGTEADSGARIRTDIGATANTGTGARVDTGTPADAGTLADSGAGGGIAGLPEDGSGFAIAVLPTATADPVAALQWAENAWVAPGLARLTRGELRELLLIVGTRCYRATRARLWRAWRRDVAWWEALAAAPDEDG